MKVVAQNRRARFDLDITDTLEAGIMLTGSEVKSCRASQVNLQGSYVSFLGNKPMIKSMKISRYKYSTDITEAASERERELLLKKSERDKLQKITEEKGMTIVPLEVRAGKYIKVLLGIGRGRKKGDKRQRIKERETARQAREGRD